jgi:putative inorganic carbon (hco3(-)) transporter
MIGWQARPGPSIRPVGVIAAGAAVASVGLGVLAATSPSMAALALVAGIAVPAAIVKPRLIPHLVLASVFAQGITLGGTSANRLVAPLALIAAVSALIQRPQHLSDGRGTVVAVIAYSALALGSLVWTLSVSETYNSLGSLGIALTFMAVFALLVTTAEDVRAVMWTMFGCAIALGAWWIASFLRGVPRNANPAGDPNFTAALEVVALPVAVALAVSAKDAAIRMVLLVGIAVIVGGVVATVSRSGVLALAATVALMLVLPVRLLFRTRRRKAAVLVAAGVAAVILLPLASDQFFTRLHRADVTSGRQDEWRAALHGYSTRPLTGLGFGAFKASSFGLLSTTPGVDLRSHSRFEWRAGEEVHNTYLASLAELGPLGLVLIVAILVSTARSLHRTARRAEAVGDDLVRTTAVALMIGLAGFAVSSFFLSAETSGRSFWVVVGLSIALPAVQARHRQPVELSTPAGVGEP